MGAASTDEPQQQQQQQQAEETPAAAAAVLALHEPGGGWALLGGRPSVVQVACGRDVVYGRTAQGQVLYWKQLPQEKQGQELRFDGPFHYSELRRATVTHIAGPCRAVPCMHTHDCWKRVAGRVGHCFFFWLNANLPPSLISS